MKTPWILSLALLGALAVPSHAIFGIGGQWAPAPDFQVKANQDTIAKGSRGPILLDEKGTTGLQGFGVKMWFDALPVVNIELTGNMQFGYYNENLILPGDTTPVKFKLDMPFLEAKPFFARAYGDAAVLYPFLKLPPLVNLLTVYAGGGVTYGVATQTLTAKFAKQTLADAQAKGQYDPNTTSDEATVAILATAIKNAGFENGMGGFIQLGAHVKPPVIPIAVYLDFKYHFMAFNPDLIGGADLTMELGGALAF